MSKNFRKSLGAVGPALHDILSSIVETNDLAAAGQLKTFKELVALTIMAEQAGIDREFMLRLISTFRIDRAGYEGGEIQMAGSASTGFETKEGTALHVDFKAAGSLVRFQVTPDNLSEELKGAVVQFMTDLPPNTEIPGLPKEFETPTLEILREMLPDLAKLFTADPEDSDGS
jgi:hypothetical protein